jgi:hypothetical protein
MEGTKYPEYKMGLDREGNATPYGKGYWARGIVDLLIVDGDHGFIVDYKTGSNKYPEPKQLKLMALMTFAHFPQVHKSFLAEEYTRDDIPKLWAQFKPDLERLQLSYENDVWQTNPTALCGWCPVKTCEYHKER